MNRRRRYRDGCAVAQALDVLGERWALLVIRELILGPRRFSDLRADLAGIAPTVLSQRLADLVAAGVLRHRLLPPPGAVQVYELSSWGAEIEPLFRVLGRWAAQGPAPVGDGPLSVSSVILSLRATFDPGRAGPEPVAVMLILAGRPFLAEIEDRRLSVEPGRLAAPDAVAEGSPDALAAVIHRGAAPAAAGLDIAGDAAAFARFARCFPPPRPAPP